MSAAMPGLGLPQQPIAIPERNTFVSAEYLQNPHADENMPVYERVDGQNVPLLSRGVQVTIAMIPPERRYAVDAEGVLLPQAQFERLHQDHFETWFDLNSVDPTQRPDPSKRFIPNVRNFCCERVNDAGDGYIEIGFDPRKPMATTRSATPRPTDVVSGDDMASGGFVKVPEGVTASEMVGGAEAAAKLADENEKLKAQLAEIDAEKERKREQMRKAREARGAKKAQRESAEA